MATSRFSIEAMVTGYHRCLGCFGRRIAAVLKGEGQRPRCVRGGSRDGQQDQWVEHNEITEA